MRQRGSVLDVHVNYLPRRLLSVRLRLVSGFLFISLKPSLSPLTVRRIYQRTLRSIISRHIVYSAASVLLLLLMIEIACKPAV